MKVLNRFLALSLSLLLALCPMSGASAAGEEMFTNRDRNVDYSDETCVSILLQGDGASCESEDVTIEKGIITIQKEGTYIVSGTLENGMVIVDAGKNDKVRLVLDGAEICCETSAALYVRQADKVFVTLAPDTHSSLTAGGEFVAIDENNIDAAVFSKDDLTVNGSGALTVTSIAGHGIVCKDDLCVTGGEIEITAALHGLNANDSVRLGGGSLTIIAGKDGIHAEKSAENNPDGDLGFVYMEEGTLKISAGGDGISAGANLTLRGGTAEILAGGGCENAAKEHAEAFGFSRGAMLVQSTQSNPSAKGLKAGGDLIFSGGAFALDAADDALHAGNDVLISGGELRIATGDDGVHADNAVYITDGTIQITESYEGIEGKNIAISGGAIALTASDDGINAAGGSDQSGFGGRGMKDAFSTVEGVSIVISGGTLFIDAQGDGIDSNGDLTISGGEIFVSGPTDSRNGALDYNGSGCISGGTVLAAGASGMAQSLTATGEQAVIFANIGVQSAGSAVRLTDADGKTLLEWESGKAFNSLLLSCPGITLGSTYTLTVGDTTQTVQPGVSSAGSAGDSWGTRGGGGHVRR